jgi:hypothetical protein
VYRIQRAKLIYITRIDIYWISEASHEYTFIENYNKCVDASSNDVGVQVTTQRGRTNCSISRPRLIQIAHVTVYGEVIGGFKMDNPRLGQWYST